jgi:hypothetical protein
MKSTYRNVAEQLVRHCANMPLSTLKRVLYKEVNPALGGNRHDAGTTGMADVGPGRGRLPGQQHARAE